jgi:hypothetical protein
LSWIYSLKKKFKKLLLIILEKYRKDYVELEEVDHLGKILLKVEDILNKKIELKKKR